MNALTKLHLLKIIVQWRLTWDKRNTKFKPPASVKDNPKFMSPWDAISKYIKDGDVVSTSGLGGNQRASILYWAIRELFEATGHPRDLTIMSIGGQGGRGIAPGTVEELGLPGLTTRFISGHMETFKSLLKLGDNGDCEIQMIPQGTMALLFAAQAEGKDSVTLPAGVGTFVDPRVGRGTPLCSPDGKAVQLVEPDGDQLKYTIPKIGVSIFNAPAADRKGNIYVRKAAMIGESYEMSIAAKKNGGRVIANVGKIVEEGYGDIFLPADMVDAVCYYPRTEQTGAIYHRKPLEYLTTESKVPVEEGIAQMNFINQVLGITPRRSELDYCLARLAASVFADNAKKGSYVNIGVGLPEQVCRLLNEGGLFDDITLLAESGVLGGIPAPGIFFGAGSCPTTIVTSPEIFKRCYENLDVTCLGLLQADSEGNVNVSKRGEGCINYVGPGGFMDLTSAAKMIVFVGTWMAHAKMEFNGSGVKIVKPGTPKFVDKVDEITFSGQQALKMGKKVFYVSNVGVFQLTEKGMELIRVMPGIDIQNDIIAHSTMKIILPESGQVPVVDESIVSGKNFKLSLKN